MNWSPIVNKCPDRSSPNESDTGNGKDDSRIRFEVVKLKEFQNMVKEKVISFPQLRTKDLFNRKVTNV